MASQLLHIQPSQLTFGFELKQSSCLVHLANHTPHHVAFKVKTTSPNNYSVRPTLGLINPQTSSHFTVTLQAQLTPHLHCKDKFLILSTIVPSATTLSHLSSHLFAKDTGKHVDEKKLKVVLLSPPSSPQDGAHRIPSVEIFDEHTREELRLSLRTMEAKLRQAQGTITKLQEERRRDIRENNFLMQELEAMKRKINVKRTKKGFPLLFVFVVALVSVAAGYYIHP